MAPPAPEAAEPSARAHLVPGEIVHVDLVARGIVVKPDGRGAAEITFEVSDQTRLMSRGRQTRLEDLRTGERVLVSCSDEGARHRATLVKVGTRPAAGATPRPASPSPAPGGTPRPPSTPPSPAG